MPEALLLPINRSHASTSWSLLALFLSLSQYFKESTLSSFHFTFQLICFFYQSFIPLSQFLVYLIFSPLATSLIFVRDQKMFSWQRIKCLPLKHERNTTTGKRILLPPRTGSGWDRVSFYIYLKFIAACMVLCFRFCDKTSVHNAPVFWLLLYSTCTVSKLSLFLSLLLSPANRLGWARSWEWT